MIEFKGVYKAFSGQQVLQGIDLQIARGQSHFVIGMSGAGKSVLLKMVVGLIKADRGEIWLDQVNISDASEETFKSVRKRVAMVMQQPALLDSLTVLENVALPLWYGGGHTQSRARELALAALAEQSLLELQNSLPVHLGSGLQKRIAIARALALRPEYIIFDEPTTGVDQESARQIDRLIQSRTHDMKMTSIVISHDLVSIRSTAQTVTMLHHGRTLFSGSIAALVGHSDAGIQQFLSGDAKGPL